MRFTVSPEQHKFFHTQGYLEVEDLLTVGEVAELKSAIGLVHVKSPGYPQENLFRSIPLISSLAKKRGWGQVAAELLHKKPLRIAFDKFFTSSPTLTETIDEDSCGLLIKLDTRRGFFFKKMSLDKNLYTSSQNCYFLLILTSKHLPNQMNPVVFQ